MDKVSIVHIPAIAFDPADLFHIMVQTVCGCQSKYLTDLTAKANAHGAKCVNEMLCQSDYAIICEFLPENALDKPVRHAIKEFGEVKQENIAFCPVFAVVLL